MHSVGEKLRNERQRQNRTLSAIASETCINARYLEAIEADDLSVIPGGFFYKSFVKQYSSAVGVEFCTIEAEVEKMMPAVIEDPLPALSVAYQVAKTEGRITRFPNRTTWAAALLIVTLACGGGFYHWWQTRQPSPGDPPAESLQPVQAALVEVPITPASTSAAAEQEPPVASPPAEPAPEPTEATVVPVPDVSKPEPVKLSVGISAKEKTWVSVSSGGKTVFKGYLRPSQTKNIEGLESAKVVTRNAAGLDISWNGKPIGPLGLRGQKRMIVFTPENFQIISRRRM